MRVDDKGSWPKWVGGVEQFSQLKIFYSDRIACHVTQLLTLKIT